MATATVTAMTAARPGTSPFLALPPPERRRTPDHPPYAEMIQAAIRTLAEKGGSTAVAIDRYIRNEHHDLPWGHHNLFPHYLRKLVVAGEIKQNKVGRFLLSHPGATAPRSSFRTPRRKSSKLRRDRRNNLPSVSSNDAATEDGGFIPQPQVKTPVSPDLQESRGALAATRVDDPDTPLLNVDGSAGALNQGSGARNVQAADAVPQEDEGDDNTGPVSEPADSNDSFEVPIISVVQVADPSRGHQTPEKLTSSPPPGNDSMTSAETSKKPHFKTNLDPLSPMHEEPPPQGISGGDLSKRIKKKTSKRKTASVPVTLYVEKEIVMALPSPKIDMFSQKWPSYTTATAYPRKPHDPDAPPHESSITVPLSPDRSDDAQVDTDENKAAATENLVSCAINVSGDRVQETEESELQPSSLPMTTEVTPSTLGGTASSTQQGRPDMNKNCLSPLPEDVNLKDDFLEKSKVSTEVVERFSAISLSDYGTVTLPDDRTDNNQTVDQDGTHVIISGKSEIPSLADSLYHEHATLIAELEILAQPRPPLHSDTVDSVLSAWKRRQRKKGLHPVRDNLTHVSSVLQSAITCQSSVSPTRRLVRTSPVSDEVTESAANPNSVVMFSDQFHPCDPHVTVVGSDAGSCQKHEATPTSETVAISDSPGIEFEHSMSTPASLGMTKPPFSTGVCGDASSSKRSRRLAKKESNSTQIQESGDDGGNATQLSSEATVVALTELSSSIDNSGDDALLPKRRRLAKKQSNPTRLQKGMIEGNGYERGDGVESEPLPAMTDKSSLALRAETTVASDKEVEELEPPLSSELDLLVIKQPPSAVRSGGSALPRRLGRPPKKKRCVPMAETVRFGNSGHEVTNSKSMVQMVEEGKLSEDAARPPALSGSSGFLPLKRRGRSSNNLSSGAPKTPKTFVRLQSLLNLRSRASGQSLASPDEQAASRNNRDFKSLLQVDSDADHYELSSTLTEAIPNPQPLVSVAEAGSLSVDVVTPATGSGLSTPRRRGRLSKKTFDLSPITTTTPNTCSGALSLRNLRAEARGTAAALSSENDTPLDGSSVSLSSQSHQGISLSNIFEVPITPKCRNDEFLLPRRGRPPNQKHKVVDIANDGSSSGKHHGEPCNIKSDVPDGNKTGLLSIKRRGRLPKEKLEAEVEANDMILLSKLRGKLPKLKSEIPDGSSSDGISLSTHRGRSPKGKLEVLVVANDGLSLSKHCGDHPAKPKVTDGASNGLSLSKRCGRPPKEKLEVPVVANDGLSSSKRRLCAFKKACRATRG